MPSGKDTPFVCLCLVFKGFFHNFFLFDSSGPNDLVEQYGLQKISLLREFCLKTGVQVHDS